MPVGRPRTEAKRAIIEAMDLERHFSHWRIDDLSEAFCKQLLACEDPAARRILLGISEKGDPGRIPALNVRKRKLPQNHPLPPERKTACSSN